MTQNTVADTDYDVAIVGGGPAGVACAISVVTEGPSVVILDEKGPGGQVATSSLIENVFGIPVGGLTGVQLMGRGIDQAHAFGTRFNSPFRAVRIVQDPATKIFTVVATSRKKVTAKAVVLTLGASARHLEAQGIEQYLNRGVAYGSPQYQVPKQWEGKRVGLVGGGNSAGQAALFLSNCIDCQVNVFVRGEGLEGDMSKYLFDRVNHARNITVHSHSTLREVRGTPEAMTHVVLTQREKLAEYELDYLLISIGAEPQTGWLEGTVALDDKGYILSDRDLPPNAWTENRPYFRYETSQPGVFTGGDVHSGSPNRMSCAVGEGHALAISVYKYLMYME